MSRWAIASLVLGGATKDLRTLCEKCTDLMSNYLKW